MSEPRSLMNCQYAIERRKPVLYIFGRKEEGGERIRTRVTGFRPHFWRSCEPDDPDVELDHFGRPIKIIYTEIPTDVREERTKYAYHCEADVLFNIRYLISKGITCGYKVIDGKVIACPDPGIKPLVLHFDAEVKSPQEIMPREDDPKFPVVAISTSTSRDGRVIVFLTGIESDWTEKIVTREWIDKRGDPRKVEFEVELRLFFTERELLEAFLKYIRDLDPDVLTAYNGYWFDYPYIHKRALRLGIHVSGISPFGRVEITKGYGARRQQEYWIKGRDALDLLLVYRRWRSNLGQLPSYDFKYVVKHETGFEYTDYGDQIERLYNEDHDTLIDYCINDAFAMKLLDEEIELIDSYDRKRRISGVMISDALSNKKLIDAWLLRTRDRPLPTGRRHDSKGFTGAVVLPAKPGLHLRISIYDLASIYPNAIIAYNISPETIYERGLIKVTNPDTGEVYRFRRTPEGLLPRTVRTFLEEREKYRALKKTLTPGTHEYDNIVKRELDYKWMSVSAYGVFGYVNFRLFNETVAAAITALGRTYVAHLVAGAQKLGYEVVYGDTDSIFIKLKTDRESEAYILEKHLNKLMAEIASSHWARYAPRIKFEKRFTRFIMKRKIGGGDPAKKRYAGAQLDGKLYIRGLEPRSSANAQVTRDSVTRWLELILIEGDLPAANTYLRETYHNLPTMPANYVGIPKGIIKATKGPWVRGRDYSAKVFNYKFHPGRKPILLYVKRTRGLPNTKEICITEDIETVPEGIEVDWKKMREKTLQRKFESLLEAVGSTWLEAVKGIKQTQLTTF